MRRVLAVCLALGGCSSNGAEPSPVLLPGLYVLSRFDGAPPPAMLSRVEYPSREDRRLLRYDSVTIVDDTTFRRSYAEALVTHPAGGTPDTQTVLAPFYAGRIFHRDGAILLAPPEFLPLPVTEFQPRGASLTRRLQLSVSRCSAPPGLPPSPCELLRSEIADAFYTRP